MNPVETSIFIAEITADLTQGLPVFPISFNTTIKLRELLQSERSSLAEISTLLAKDPLVAAKAIQAANSVAMNPAAAKIVELRAAVIRLGMTNVRTLALSIAMQQFLAHKEMSRFAPLTESMLRHSREVAATAFIVAREHTRIAPDLALFAGLVHDLGVFYLFYRLSLRPDLNVSDDELRDMVDDRRDEIGHAVLAALDVPQQIKDAVGLHDAPRHVETINELDDLLYVCNLLVVRRAEAHDHLGMIAGEDSPGDASIRDFDLYMATLDEKQDEFRSLSALF